MDDSEASAHKKVKNSLKTKPVDPEPLPPVFRTDFSASDVEEMLRIVPNETVQSALDSVRLMIQRFEGTCNNVKCRSKTKLVYHQCELCNSRYCIKHCLPEVHGCAEAAKSQERKQFLEKAKEKADAQRINLKANREKNRLQAKESYTKKMDELRLARKIKPTKACSFPGSRDDCKQITF